MMTYRQLREKYEQIVSKDSAGGLTSPDWQWTLDQRPLNAGELEEQFEALHNAYVAGMRRNLACIRAMQSEDCTPQVRRFLLHQIEKELRRHARMLTNTFVGWHMREQQR